MAAYDDAITLSGGPRLALRRIDGAGRPILLVHGLSSNARTWDGVGSQLAGEGHEVVAVDLRGHGRSEQVVDGHSTEQSAADLAQLIELLGFVGAREPVVAGQSWGGNVVLALAADTARLAGAALVDGGWIRLADRFATFDDCWAALAPPEFEGLDARQLTRRLAQSHPGWSEEGLAGTLANFELLDDGTVRPWLRRDHHREIVRSLYAGAPADLYPRVDVPVLLVPAITDPPNEADVVKRVAVNEAAELIPDAEVRWYVGADHDLHVQQPRRFAGDLLSLVARAEATERT